MKLPVVLNTRPREQAAELTRLLHAAGFVVAEAPAIDIVTAWDPADLARVRAHLYEWVVLASANAGRDLSLGSVRVPCGTATAQALGISPSITLERFSAAAALDAIRPRLAPGDRVLAPRAADGRPELVDGLRALGAEVDAPVAYRTVAVDAAAQRLRQGGIDVGTICSPSAAESIAPALTERTRVVCLGETTADAVRALGRRVDAVAHDTSMPGLVAAVQGVSVGVTV